MTFAAVRSHDDTRREHFLSRIAALRAEVAKTIVGQEEVLDEILMAVLAGGHALLVGVPGLAKTLMIRSMPAPCISSSGGSSSRPISCRPTSRGRR